MRNADTGLIGPRHFLELDELPAADLRRIVDAARARKEARKGLPKGAADADAPLAGHTLAMVFEKPSTRTRTSFDMAIRQLGGSAMVMNSADLQLGRGETIADTARVLSGYVDAIMLRTFDPQKLTELADNADVPVINGLTDRSHPCQILADLMTFEEVKGPLKGAKIAWTGDGNNVAATFVQAAAVFGFELAVACPDSLRPNAEILRRAQQRGAKITVTSDASKAAAGADCIVTDTWLSMNDTDGVRQARHNLLRPYQVDDALMARAKPDAIFMHCLPAHREEEATASVMDGPQSVIFDEAENRLHAQKAILLWCFGKL
ncbi:MAG: ornithine carbamoyltransferase [Rhodobacteraceae bacterium]|nr:ornithine carbamoyltransferase [Paracoccaceae bacterium]